MTIDQGDGSPGRPLIVDRPSFDRERCRKCRRRPECIGKSKRIGMLLTVSINTPELLKILDASPHAVKLMIDRGISIDDANSYVADAKVMFIQAKGERQAFYS